MECLYKFGDPPEGSTSTTSLCNAVPDKLPSGQFSFKKVTTVAQERFTIANMAYTQLFVDYLYGKDPYTLKSLTSVEKSFPMLDREIMVT